MEMSTLIAQLTALPPATLGFVILGAMTLLYFGRGTVHSLVDNIFLGFYRLLRIVSASVSYGEKQLAARNRVVMMGQGRDHYEREIDREFRLLNSIVQRDLATYPAVQRQISEQIISIEEGYKGSEPVPAPGPDWVAAVEAVATLSKTANDETTTAKLLEEIHKASKQQHHEVLDAYREQVKERHQRLDYVKSYWRKLTNSVDEVGLIVQSLLDRSAVIDARMTQYEEIIKDSYQAERSLRASALTQFMISFLVVGIAVGGGFINFHLIALSMSETLSAGGHIAGMPVSDVAAMFVILLEVSLGLMLMETLRITNLFPAIAALDDKVLKRLAVIFFVFLLAFAFMEAALAFMRDEIARDNAALRQSLGGVSSSDAESSINEWIPLAGQMIMGFVIPFALAFVAIPLESLLHSGRIIVGHMVGLCLRTVATFFRVAAALSRQLGRIINNFYDFLILPFIWIERLLGIGKRKNPKPSLKPAAALLSKGNPSSSPLQAP
jgi:hypothetical protein